MAMGLNAIVARSDIVEVSVGLKISLQIVVSRCIDFPTYGVIMEAFIFDLDY